MLAVCDVSVVLSQRPILDDVSLAVPPGCFTAILGPNGSGKTTLLRALSGEIAYAGTVTLNGHEVRALKPWEAAAMRAVLEQTTTLAFPFTVREVVSLGVTAGRSGLDREQLRTLPERALERVELAGFAGRSYQDLSGGEQQRVQLARVLCQVWRPVLAGAPRYLLLDEPVSSLDVRHQLAIMGIARAFAAAGGGVVAILHDLNLAALFADQMVFMRAGEIVAAGAPAEVLDDALLEQVFATSLRVGALPAAGIPFVLPQSAAPLSSR
jgi:iron complex transport system ATP-binding protein